ncbi:hypothetical protein AQUCO_03700160v1 [Aquilegia coerulea]|uniref:Uncharacterized protein n=1 Tax=Aquilegia coerulea TaxID=218851 RepID=A0A2G5CTT1_AQUCA|nr:hypothetical protein AQUCO_03700160v1 [Aquilegia coerulea]
MGNCMETYSSWKPQEEMKQEENEQQFEDFPMENAGLEKGGFRLKIVLRKDELEMLMYQLNDRRGKTLEDLLSEIEKGRGKVIEEVKSWKPSLESIMESPEVYEMDRSI